MRISFQLLLLVWVILITPAQGQNEEALGKQIAETLGYPLQKFTIADKSAEYAEKSKNQIITVLSIEAVDEGIPSASIAIGRKGSMLSPELEAHCEKLLTERPSIFRKLDFPQGAYGYTGLGMAGPGGSEEQITATWPERGIDLQIKVTFRGDVPLNSMPEGYDKLTKPTGGERKERFTAAMGLLVDYSEKTFPRVPDGSRRSESPDKAPGGRMAPERSGDTGVSKRASRPTKDAWPIAALLAGLSCGLLLWRMTKGRRRERERSVHKAAGG